MMKDSKIFVLACALFFVASCKTPTTIAYFQDTVEGSQTELPVSNGIAIRPNDKIAITVYSRDANLANMFNMPYYSFRIGSPRESTQSNYTQGISPYQVTADGDIDFPVLGMIHIAGLTRSEASNLIKEKLLESGLIKDPIVTVDFTNNFIVLMGEVVTPGRFPIDRDGYTIFDALGAAGDLTIFGERECVKVLRTEEGVRKTYVINLCDSENVLTSPVYFMQPDDVIYVTPNRMRKRQSTVNGNNIESVSFWLSVASLLVTISYYFVFSGLARR